MSHLIAGFSLFYGIWTFYSLNQKGHRIRRNCTTLTEAFIVKEILNVIKVLKPLIIAYFLLLVFAGTVYTIMFGSFLMGVMDEKDVFYTALLTSDYVLVDTYNIYSTCSMVWHFKQLRRIFFKDITSIVQSNKVYSTAKEDNENLDKFNVVEQGDVYFNQLTDFWNSELLRKTFTIAKKVDVQSNL
ncbi:unnamed protein product [Bursaphelenchus okinawaensis]|uniref:7TM_GPCR_Srx domain-containing protein n=1 Tax=Bursaphelenchus okinawaensis TaxID=465554 RepID=A0A811KVH2_9BILA|nr:unnamed protein product [Bursaphelenchus okinawaensis]CAG9113988.1 unnamed protein product [Bursaphelenchus okinawaensis]